MRDPNRLYHKMTVAELQALIEKGPPGAPLRQGGHTQQKTQELPLRSLIGGFDYVRGNQTVLVLLAFWGLTIRSPRWREAFDGELAPRIAEALANTPA